MTIRRDKSSGSSEAIIPGQGPVRFNCLIWAGFLIINLILPGCNFATESDHYVTKPITRMDLQQSVVASGAINPIETVLVGAQVSGIIKEILVDYNSEVRRGQVIARIDPRVFEAKVDQCRSALELARAEVEKAKTNLSLATSQFKRYESLWRQRLVSELDLDNNRALYETAQAEFRAAQARASQAAAQLTEAETNLGYTNITSPVNGIVISRNVEVGRTVVASFQTPTLFTIAQDLTQMQVEAAVDGAEVGDIKVGQAATFTVDAYTDKVFSGKIDQVRLAPQTTQNVVTYTVLIQTPNPDLLLKPGMIATVTILTDARTGVLAVPNAALRFQPRGHTAPEAAGRHVVWRLEANEVPRPVLASCGISNGLWTELKNSPLQEGDLVIIDQVSGTRGGGMGLRSLFY